MFIPHKLYIPQSKEEGESKRLPYHDTRTNKVITFLVPKTPSNHTLGQNTLVVAIHTLGQTSYHETLKEQE